MGEPFATFEVVVPTVIEDDAVCVLWECGTAGVEVGEPSAGLVRLTASFPRSVDLEARLREALSALAGSTLRPVEVPEVDWVARFREDFHSFSVAGFDVVPEWEGRPPGPDVIVIDPGRAFGTGTHRTTRFCLELLVEEAALRPLGRVLDVGAGTGILGLAAARRGAQLVVAADFDPEATASCAVHARLNDVPLRVVQADGGRPFGSGSRFDLVLANLMAPLLIERSDELRALCAPGAVLILSGLLTEDVPAVASAYGTRDARPVEVSERGDGEWAALRVRLS